MSMSRKFLFHSTYIFVHKYYNKHVCFSIDMFRIKLWEDWITNTSLQLEGLLHLVKMFIFSLDGCASGVQPNQVQATSSRLLIIWFVGFWNEVTNSFKDNLLVACDEDDLFRVRSAWYLLFLVANHSSVILSVHILFFWKLAWQSPSFSLLN